ncbi:haloacid dehalogenase [Thermus scotoductus]|uniref:Haloacid dehalogenase n=1 Tax=Thermus scotoductus TaxID=37636 RepID=A0A430RMN4_THESC|nr:HAD-IA family hydrolase [Thermus scotoductus]RTH19396.1 haloacid dehalogenase [Thermus scotoductus]RTI06040.1 haloacid dehalogenase [Thermus scotoductus]
MVGKLRALLWDLDGTLAETEEVHRAAFNRAFAEMGLPVFWDRELYRSLLETTGGKERIARFLQDCPGCPPLAPEEVARLHRRKNELFAELLAQGVDLRPGVSRLLWEAKGAGLRLALATTTSPENVHAFLARTGLEGVFDLVLAGDVVPRKKPDPAIYRLALKRLGLVPSEALALEDSRNGLLAASGAGLPVLVTPGLYTAHQGFPEAQAVLTHLGEPGRPGQVLQGPRQGQALVADLAYLEEVRGWWNT